ncbi:MAG TPA: cytochrome b/b6 domain-containing protein [Burkholderiales bacterium]|nr:cytochrome b/b6 domain-containing protein [Burkholderiales bacterium]
MSTNTKTWGTVGKILHWLAAAMIFVLLAHGWWMTEFAPRAARFGHYAWHASVGYELLLLMVLRLLWRWTHPVPALPAAMPPPLRYAAVIGHWGLYLLAFAAAVSGWALAGTFKRPLDMTAFGWVRVPPLITSSDHMLHEQLEGLHEQLAWGLAILIAVHLAGAFYHWRKNDGVMQRMLPQTDRG